MKKRKKALLTSILVLPLLISNAPPAEYPETDYDYESFLVSCVHDGTYEVADNYTKEKYLITIENQGDRYPEISSDLILNGHHISSFEWKDKLFYYEKVPSGETKTYSLIAEEKLPLNDDGEDVWKFSSYSIVDENVSFSDYSIKKSDENEKLYEIASTIEGLDDYEYAAIVDVTYKGVRYAFGTDISYSGKLGSFRTFEELDLSELTIDSIKAYRSYGKRYNWFKETGEIFIKNFLSMMSDPFTWLMLSLFLIIPAAFIGLVILVSYLAIFRKKKENKNK